MKKHTVIFISVLLLATMLLAACDGNQEVTGGSQALESEIALYNQLAGGFFYIDSSHANEEEKEYMMLRKESIEIFNEEIYQFVGMTSNLYEGGFRLYEDSLLRFIDATGSLTSGHREDLQSMVTGMFKYKTAIEVLTLQIDGLKERDPADEVQEAVIDGEIFNKSVQLYNMTNEYLKYLVITKDYLSTILDNYDLVLSQSLIENTDQIYRDFITNDYAKAASKYMVASNLYVHIASSDYYYGSEISFDLEEKIQKLEDTEDVRSIQEAYSNMDTGEPGFLVYADPATSLAQKTPSFVIVAYADEVDNLAISIAVLRMADMLQLKQRVYGTLTDDDISAEMVDMILYQKNVKDEIIRLNSEQTRSFKEIETYLITEFVKSAPLLQGEGKVELSQKIKPIVMNINAMEEEIKTQKARSEIIKKLEGGQQSLKTGLASYMPTSVQYAGIISKFSDVLAEKNGNLDSNQYQQLNSLLNNGLEEVLGEKKKEFVNKFINTSADELVDTFMNWKNNSINSKDMDLDKNTLISLLNEMGIEIEYVEENEDGKENAYYGYGKYDIMLEMISYSLPLIENVDHEGFELIAQKAGISPEEAYVYTLSFLTSGLQGMFGGELTQEEQALVDEITSYLEGSGVMSKKTQEFCFDSLYSVMNKNGELDAFEKLTKEEKQAYVNDMLEVTEESEDAPSF